MSIMEGKLSYESSKFFTLRFNFCKQKQRKIKQKDYAPINKSIGPFPDSDKFRKPIKYSWKKSKHKEPYSSCKKY